MLSLPLTLYGIFQMKVTLHLTLSLHDNTTAVLPSTKIELLAQTLISNSTLDDYGAISSTPTRIQTLIHSLSLNLTLTLSLSHSPTLSPFLTCCSQILC